LHIVRESNTRLGHWFVDELNRLLRFIGCVLGGTTATLAVVLVSRVLLAMLLDGFRRMLNWTRHISKIADARRGGPVFIGLVTARDVSETRTGGGAVGVVMMMLPVIVRLID
jgi:hypothetical protein